MRKKIELARKNKEELNKKFEAMREYGELTKTLQTMKNKEEK